MKKYYVSNEKTECAAYEKVNKMAIINNSKEEQETEVYIDGRIKEKIKLNSGEIKWINIK